MRDELMRICRGKEDCIMVRDLPRDVPERFVRPAIDPARLSCRKFTGMIDRSWRVSSFSSMVSDVPHGADAAHDADAADRDALYRLSRLDAGGEEADAGGAFRLPGGARTGIMLHSVFERLHFQAGEAAIRALVACTLELHGFASDWEDLVTAMVKNALAIEIDGVVLAGVPNGTTLRELEFYLPVRRLSKRILADIFRGRGAVPPGFPKLLEELRLDETRGFLRGFIDLVFASGGKYYLLDWKSNRLGPAIEHYGQKSMEDAMVRNYYVLQYHLYTAALHAYLEKRLKGYSYREHFGGVVYVFLRGVDPVRGPEYGVYRTMPEWEVIRDLNRRLAP
jgi:exodeoxyribonuclease V beta subunit